MESILLALASDLESIRLPDVCLRPAFVETIGMFDAAMIALGAGFFVVAVLYAAACARL
jgi:hypothetical protein